MPGAQLSVQKIKYGEPYTSSSGQQGIASEDAVVVNVTDDDGSTTHIFLPVPTALQLGRLVTKEAATLIHDAVDDNGKPLYSIRERMALIYGTSKPVLQSPAIALDDPELTAPSARFAELFKEPGLIEDANASRQAQAWIDEKLHHELACPECAGPVFIAAGPKAACADPKCKFANGIFPFPRQFRPAVDGPERVPFDASSDTDGDVPVVPDPFHKARKTKLRHNHVTREMRTDGSCPSCADYFERHGIPEEEQ